MGSVVTVGRWHELQVDIEDGDGALSGANTDRCHSVYVRSSATGSTGAQGVTGVTGARASISGGLGELIARVREHTSAPVCVGFGIGTPEQTKEVGALADGVIVGSACVKTIGGSQTPVETAKQFAAEFRGALSGLRK